jgi:quinol monooxygenase YgiN
MIREVAEITIDPADEAGFLAAVGKAVPIFRAAEGCRAMRLEKIIETPGAFRLVVSWDTLAHHTDVFRNSQGFADWRGLVGGFFAAPPKVDHSETVVPGFGE